MTIAQARLAQAAVALVECFTADGKFDDRSATKATQDLVADVRAALRHIPEDMRTVPVGLGTHYEQAGLSQATEQAEKNPEQRIWLAAVGLFCEGERALPFASCPVVVCAPSQRVAEQDARVARGSELPVVEGVHYVRLGVPCQIDLDTARRLSEPQARHLSTLLSCFRRATELT